MSISHSAIEENQKDLLNYLSNRRSCPLLTEPGPDRSQIARMVELAMRVPDHRRLSPWRVIAVDQSNKDKLIHLWLDAVSSDEVQANKLRKNAAWAPVILICIASLKEEQKVPRDEQLITAGLATYTLLMAANGMNYEGYWRTGDTAYHPEIRAALGLSDKELIIGCLYIGTGTADNRIKQNTVDFHSKLGFLS